MAQMCEAFRKALPIIAQLPNGAHFDTLGTDLLSLQAGTQAEVQARRALFPGVVWKRTWDKDCKWWDYRCTYEGLRVDIYACKENPPQCTAIYETRQVEKVITDTSHTEVVEERVLVGWDCGKPTEDEAFTRLAADASGHSVEAVRQDMEGAGDGQ